MKKFVLILSALFAVSCAHNVKYDKEFKNPVFNQPLEPLGSTEGLTYLTTTSIEVRRVRHDENISVRGKCDLLENEQDRITLKCKLTVYDWNNMPTSETYTKYYTYVIKDVFMPSCLRILKYYYSTPDKFPNSESRAAKYCVTPPRNML